MASWLFIKCFSSVSVSVCISVCVRERGVGGVWVWPNLVGGGKVHFPNQLRWGHTRGRAGQVQIIPLLQCDSGWAQCCHGNLYIQPWSLEEEEERMRRREGGGHRDSEERGEGKGKETNLGFMANSRPFSWNTRHVTTSTIRVEEQANTHTHYHRVKRNAHKDRPRIQSPSLSHTFI